VSAIGRRLDRLDVLWRRTAPRQGAPDLDWARLSPSERDELDRLAGLARPGPGDASGVKSLSDDELERLCELVERGSKAREGGRR
jgi:hypothetical protein